MILNPSPSIVERYNTAPACQPEGQSVYFFILEGVSHIEMGYASFIQHTTGPKIPALSQCKPFKRHHRISQDKLVLAGGQIH